MPYWSHFHFQCLPVVAFYVSFNPVLTLILVPVFTQATRTLQIISNAALVSIVFPALTSAVISYGSFAMDFQANAVLQSILFPLLTSVSAPFSHRAFYIVANPNLSVISLPVLASITARDVVCEIDSNPNLSLIFMPVLASATASSGILIFGMSGCLVVPVLASTTGQISLPSGKAIVRSDNTGTCVPPVPNYNVGTTVCGTTECCPACSGLESCMDNTCIAPLAVTLVSPTEGPEDGGTMVVITGTGFTTANGVTFGPFASPLFSVDSATQITAQSPAGTGTVNILISTPSGSKRDLSAPVLASEFEYLLLVAE